MSANRGDLPVATQRPGPDTQAAGGGFIARHMGAAVLLLFLSTLVFCVLVILNRDHNARIRAVADLEKPCAEIQHFIDEEGYLPSRYPIEEPATAAIAYPQLHELIKLRASDGPFVVYAGPVVGLIMPKKDGFPAIIYERGKLRTAWLTSADLREERARRKAIVEGTAKS